jgi:O-acetyl-ADP-ribose deacetylase (regulator of RNase III)
MEPEILTRLTTAGCAVEVVVGDLTAERVDAVVNAANERLAHGGGLAAAVVRRGGPSIQEESDRVAPVPVGGAAVTGAGHLPARWVVHAVGPRWGEGEEEAKLRRAVRSALDAATRAGARSVAVPAVSTGIFGYPLAEGTRTIVGEALAWLGEAPDRLDRLRLVALDRTTAEAFAAALSAAASPAK